MSLCAIDTPLCTQLLCVKITGVKAVESPDFIKHRLKSAGINPRNLLVDVTNYICLDLGQPLHVYDADAIKGPLKACQLKTDHPFKTLDDITITLTSSDIVIADDSGPIGLAGIMGGLSTTVRNTTNAIILEAAVFDAVAIAGSGQRHNINSNARARFERGIDPVMTEVALKKAIDLIVTYGGGAVDATDYHKTPIKKRVIVWDPTLMETRTGVILSQEKMTAILTRLGCTVFGNEITVPTWRHDLQIPVDLVEELLRITGYDALPTQSLPPKACIPQTSILTDVSSLGFQECVTLSFTTQHKASLFSKTLVEIDNPISQDLSTMKPSLLCGLLDTAKHNLNYGQEQGAFYEVGKRYFLTEASDFPGVTDSSASRVEAVSTGIQEKELDPGSQETLRQQSSQEFRKVREDRPGQSEETRMMAGLRYGQYDDRSWHTLTRSVDIFDAKADCLAALKQLGLADNQVQLTRDVPTYYHPQQSGCFKQGKKILGYFGTIHPSVLKAYDIKKICVGFEVFLENIPVSAFKPKSFVINDLQKTRLDLSFMMDRTQEAGPICQLIAKTPLVQDVSVFDVYTGQGIPEDKKAVAIQFIVQPTEKNLTDTDIQNLMQGIVQTVNTKFNATLRA
ncbi:MAG: phenylalanine--tRNA ligase subunit beta [Pseudomonadota bacterium]